MHESSVRKIIKDKDEIKLQLSRTAEYGAKQKTKTKKKATVRNGKVVLCLGRRL